MAQIAPIFIKHPAVLYNLHNRWCSSNLLLKSILWFLLTSSKPRNYGPSKSQTSKIQEFLNFIEFTIFFVPGNSFYMAWDFKFHGINLDKKHTAEVVVKKL